MRWSRNALERAHRHPVLMRADILRALVNRYRSRHPTLSTVRIAGDGSVWVDGARRVIYYRHDSRSIHYPAQRTGDFRTWALRAVASVADAMEVVR